MKEAGSKSPKRILLAPLLAALVLSAGLAFPTPLRANCLVGYADCVDAASELNSFWRRSAGGIICFLDLVSCLQDRIG